MASAPKILHIAGWGTCGFYRRVSSVLTSLSLLFPNRLKVVEHDFVDRTRYREWLVDGGFRDHFAEISAKSHVACPFVWCGKMFKEGDPDPKDIDMYVGGHDDTLEWCRKLVTPQTEQDSKSVEMADDGHKSDHGYEYDLVVIGGGSGGMAAAKEAASLGAKVACLDFVKPSPKGTTWGLGGTCVNVGCIPKKLFHIGASIRESIQADSGPFGIKVISDDKDSTMNGSNGEDVSMTMTTPDLVKVPDTNWDSVRLNVQNYIRSLNFKYRVRLREKNVTYLNKLAKFTDKHTIEAVDKKGRTNTITSSRFLIATGGRPAPIDCPGGELAISSDDIFFLEKNPGKTLCVGASYISLECAGFLAGFGNDVTVAVRSILLRGFDRECTSKIGDYMKEHGVNFKMEVVPTKLEKVDERIKVTFSNGTDDVYDTVLGAIGRVADTDKLGLESVGVETNPKNRKILTTHEQSSCPNIYAIGDVMEGCPELTPVAIQAGLYLARRLFGGSKEPMDYVNVCTTVFTPIEYSCVGLSEDDAIAKYGEDGIEVYHSEFVPLQWSISTGRSHVNAYTKVVVDKGDKVLGIHYVGPDAGEIMQGYGVAMKQGLSFKTLQETVGIHPTSSEEIVTLSVTKSSGEDAAAGGC